MWQAAGEWIVAVCRYAVAASAHGIGSEKTCRAGGGMVEKSLSAKATTAYVLNGREMNTETNKLSMKELQWSVNAAAGIQLNITREVGIYAEPGVGYYFDNGSDVKTAYSDNPFNFNMKLGLRYSIK